MERRRPTFSVVIPVYDAGDALVAALASCLSQTQPPREVIVVDDGSRDGAVGRAQQWWDRQLGPRPLLRVVTQANAGPAAARNRGWDLADGDLVAFLDADDLWEPTKIERIADAWNSAPGIVAMGHRHAVEGQPRRPGRGGLQRVPLLGVVARNPFVTPALVVARHLPLRFDRSFRYTEDHELLVRLAAAGPVYRLDHVLAVLRRPPLAPGGLSSNRLAMRAGELRMYARLGGVRWWLAPLVPALLVFSMAKHAVAMLRQKEPS